MSDYAKGESKEICGYQLDFKSHKDIIFVPFPLESPTQFYSSDHKGVFNIFSDERLLFFFLCVASP